MQASDERSVSIIIPTACHESRAELIHRAINSIYLQAEVDAEIIVVVNGNQFHAPLRDMLEKDSRLVVKYREEANVSSARFAGLQQAKSKLIGFLDDDDELLPDTLGYRINRMNEAPEVDVFVTNGYSFSNMDKVIVDTELEKMIREDLTAAFLESNWFASAAPLFRVERLDPQLFSRPLKYFEWTYLYFSLIASKANILYDSRPTYRIHLNHQDSVSRSEDYLCAYPDFLEQLIKLSINNDTRSKLLRKRQAALNSVSVHYLKNNQNLRAAHYHTRTLMAGGWRYFPYSRKILSSFFGRGKR